MFWKAFRPFLRKNIKEIMELLWNHVLNRSFCWFCPCRVLCEPLRKSRTNCCPDLLRTVLKVCPSQVVHNGFSARLAWRGAFHPSVQLHAFSMTEAVLALPKKEISAGG